MSCVTHGNGNSFVVRCDHRQERSRHEKIVDDVVMRCWSVINGRTMGEKATLLSLLTAISSRAFFNGLIL